MQVNWTFDGFMNYSTTDTHNEISFHINVNENIPKSQITKFICIISVNEDLRLDLYPEFESKIDISIIEIEKLNKDLKCGCVKLSSKEKKNYIHYFIPNKCFNPESLLEIIQKTLEKFVDYFEIFLDDQDDICGSNESKVIKSTKGSIQIEKKYKFQEEEICEECECEIFDCICEKDERFKRENFMVIQIFKKYPEVFDMGSNFYSETYNIYAYEPKNLLVNNLKSFKVTKETFEDFKSLLANLEANKLYFKRLPISILMCSIKNETIRHFFLAPCLRTANEFTHYFDSDFPSDPQELELFSIKTKKTIMNDFYKLVSSNLNKKTLKNEDFINLQSFTESNVTDTSLKLGEGGFANVYSNHLINSQKQFTQKCALKIPHLKKESALMSRLRVEYEYYALKQLKHSSFTEVYGVFEVEDEDQKSLIKLGICMELLEGKSLKENVNSMTSQEKIQAMTQVAQGLSHMHAQGYVHQDIKPSNIIWHNGKAKIIDFGFAVEEESINQCIGFSYEYADPNHLKKNSPGKPADVWSWAVTFVSIFMKLEPYKDVVDRNVFRIDPNAKGPGKISIIERIYLELEVKKKRPFFYRLENELGIVIIELLKSCMNSNYRNRPQMSEIAKTLERLDS